LKPPADTGAEDRRLISRASRGDVAAFSRLVEAHSNLVYQKALSMLGADDAQDASQEVWAKVWANIGKFRAESAFGTWLYRITVNTCLSFRRREARREQREGEGEARHLSEALGGDADPEAAALNSERRQEVRVALGRIRTEHRAALVLRHMEGLSYAEIAEVLGVPDGTAKGWVSRGRAAMLGTLALEGSPPAMPARRGTASGKRVGRLPGLSPSA
jgi:RNA polymerase sigma-70 factor (ECF subfamily)